MFPGFNPRMEEDLSIMTIDNMSKAVLLSHSVISDVRKNQNKERKQIQGN